MGCDFKSPVGNNSVLLFICNAKTPSEDLVQHIIQADEKCTLCKCYLHLLCKEQLSLKENCTNICPVLSPKKHQLCQQIISQPQNFPECKQKYRNNPLKKCHYLAQNFFEILGVFTHMGQVNLEFKRGHTGLVIQHDFGEVPTG